MEQIVKVKDLVRVYVSTRGILRKERYEIRALNGITFSIKKGEIFGLLGPNGAGKTTTIKILTTLLAPTSGIAEVFGYKTFGEEKKIRPKINFIFGGERSLYWRLSALDNLNYFSDLYKIDKKTRMKRIPYLLDLVGLSDRAKERVETYSKGMKQRLQIARGLINDPEIIFLDEPSIGLDPVGAKDLRRLIKELNQRGKTILLTTHYMYEADELCNRIGIINRGNLIALDAPENLKKKNASFKVIELYLLGIDQNKMNAIKNIDDLEVLSIKQQEQIQIISAQCKDSQTAMNRIKRVVNENDILKMDSREATLEDVYIKLVGNE